MPLPFASAAQHIDGDAEEIGKLPKIGELRFLPLLPLADALLRHADRLCELSLRHPFFRAQRFQIFRKLDLHKKSLQLFLWKS